MIDYATIKGNHDLEEYIVGKLGPPKGSKWLCPFHDEKTPSFGLWDNGEKFKCFGCGCVGDIFDFIMMYNSLGNAREAAETLGNGTEGDKAEIRARQERARLAREKAKEEKQQAAISKVSRLESKVEWYHSQVDNALEYWQSQGIDRRLIDKHKLGFAPLCPMLYPSEIRQSSYVLPCFQQGKLLSIRHRLSQPNGHGKYRPEFKGLPPQLFNVDSITENIPFLIPEGHIILLEGEIKSIVVSDNLGCGCVGLPGLNTWQSEWVEHFKPANTVYLIPDPGLKQDIKSRAIGRIAADLKQAKIKTFLTTVHAKPDDLFVKFGIPPSRFIKYLERSRVL